MLDVSALLLSQIFACQRAHAFITQNIIQGMLCFQCRQLEGQMTPQQQEAIQQVVQEVVISNTRQVSYSFKFRQSLNPDDKS